MQKRITSISILVVVGLIVLTACGNFSMLSTNPLVKQDSAALPAPTKALPAPVVTFWCFRRPVSRLSRNAGKYIHNGQPVCGKYPRGAKS